MDDANLTEYPEDENIVRQKETTQARIQTFAFVIAVFICIWLCSYFGIRDGKGAEKSARVRLEGRINPNDAPLGSLVRLPGVGISRAAAIVAYRENYRKNEKRNRPFQTQDDLCKVKGIGPKTMQNISECLKFD